MLLKCFKDENCNLTRVKDLPEDVGRCRHFPRANQTMIVKARHLLGAARGQPTLALKRCINFLSSPYFIQIILNMLYYKMIYIISSHKYNWEQVYLRYLASFSCLTQDEGWTTFVWSLRRQLNCHNKSSKSNDGLSTSTCARPCFQESKYLMS